MGTQHKHAATIKAWADGADIEYKSGYGIWQDARTPQWQLDVEYRVKPSPKVAPFTVEDAPNLIGKAVINSVTGKVWLVTAIENDGVRLTAYHVDYLFLYHQYKFLDGSPCGKTVE